MKVIDLLNKIANYEEIPLKIKVEGHIYRKSNGQYWCDETEMYLINNCASIYELNKEVEIIEDTPKEDKKIEYLKLYAPYPECTDDRFEDVENKINEIIDRLNGENNE